MGIAGILHAIFQALYPLYPSLDGHKFKVEARIEVKYSAFSNGLHKWKSTQCHISLSKDIKFINF